MVGAGKPDGRLLSGRVPKKRGVCDLRKLRYTGQAKFPLEEFVRHHKEAHVILMDEGEPIPETKKVTDLLTGVQDPRLATAITHIDGDRAKLESFEESQQYLKTVITNSTIQRTTLPMMAGVRVSTVETKGSKKAANRKRKQDARKGGSKSDDDDTTPSGVKVHAGKYTPLEYKKLCLLYTFPSPRDGLLSRMPSSA